MTFFYIIAGIAGIILLWCLYKIGMERQQQQRQHLTKTQQEKLKQQYKWVNLVSGWMIALLPVIGVIIGCFVDLSSVRGSFDVAFCMADRESLKRQEVWKRGKIAWGWCLLSPVYLYKRTKLLKESMLKFWLLTAQYCILLLYLSTLFF